MKKRLFAFALVVTFLVWGLNVLAADVVPSVISDLSVDGLPFKTGATNQKLTFRFLSDQKPTDVLVNFYGTLPGRGVMQTFYSSKKNELELIVEEKGDKYEVAVTRGYGSPPFVTTVDVYVWIVGTDGKTKSNKLLQKLETVK